MYKAKFRPHVNLCMEAYTHKQAHIYTLIQAVTQCRTKPASSLVHTVALGQNWEEPLNEFPVCNGSTTHYR